MKEALLYTRSDEDSVVCHLCAHECVIRLGRIGICGVCENRSGTLYSMVRNPRPSLPLQGPRHHHRRWQHYLQRLCLLMLLALGVARLGLAADNELALGAEVYDEHCAVCHGEEGDGNGPAANRLRIKPRDFRSGIFKFRSTPSGSLPLDADLFRTLTHGIPGTAMLAQSQLTQRERWAVIRYLKEFAPRFLREQPSPPIAILVPTDLNSRVERGRQLYRTAGCTTCHGEQGWGDGPAARGLTDEWGHSIRPANLTGSSLKSGDRAGDLYRTLSTGLDGTPMPSYQHTLTDDERWAVAAYIISLPRAEDTRSHGMMGGSGMGNREEHLGRMISMMQGMGMHGHGCMGR